MDGWRPPERYLSSTQVNKCVYVAIPGTPNTLSTVIKLGPERPQHTPLDEAAAADDDDDAGDNNMAHRYTGMGSKSRQINRSGGTVFTRVYQFHFIPIARRQKRPQQEIRHIYPHHMPRHRWGYGVHVVVVGGWYGEDGGRMSIKWNWKLLLLHGTWWWVGNKVRSFIFQSIYVRVIWYGNAHWPLLGIITKMGDYYYNIIAL